MFSSAVVVRAASIGPAGEQKLRLAAASAQGAARARDVQLIAGIKKTEIWRTHTVS